MAGYEVADGLRMKPGLPPSAIWLHFSGRADGAGVRHEEAGFAVGVGAELAEAGTGMGIRDLDATLAGKLIDAIDCRRNRARPLDEYTLGEHVDCPEDFSIAAFSKQFGGLSMLKGWNGRVEPVVGALTVNGPGQGIEYRREFKNPLTRVPPRHRLGLEPASHGPRAGSTDAGKVRLIKTHIGRHLAEAFRKQHFRNRICGASVANNGMEMTTLTTHERPTASHRAVQRSGWAARRGVRLGVPTIISAS